MNFCLKQREYGGGFLYSLMEQDMDRRMRASSAVMGRWTLWFQLVVLNELISKMNLLVDNFPDVPVFTSDHENSPPGFSSWSTSFFSALAPVPSLSAWSCHVLL
ncbi:hypothetical protein GOODEAATRI_004778 [Goodea atripinnis]|uniref:Uncharacterized protein n=1 Tax=Goodea atripinnis TaxID=208336 RepID=A0ABV0PKY2_9TELE